MSIENKPAMTHDEALDTAQHESSTPEQIHGAVTAHPESHELKLHAAQHPNTSTKTLQHMYNGAEKLHTPEETHELHEQIAGHPNAPKEIAEKHFAQIKPDSYQPSVHNDIIFHPDIHPDSRAAKVKELLSHKSDAAEFEDEGAPKAAPRLSWDQKGLAKEFLHHPDTEAKHIQPFLESKHPELAGYAASSPTATVDDASAYMARKDVKPEHAIKSLESDKETEVNPHFIKAAYDRFSKEKPSKKEGYNYNNEPSDVVNKILEHKDTPKHILDQVIKSKPSKEGSWNASPRQKALEHPSTETSTVKGLVQKGDTDAMKAAMGRDDTDEESLRIMHSHVGDLGYNANRDLLGHKNFPKDLTMKAIKEDSDSARYVMNRKELDHDTMKALLDHKNKNVAVDALKHKSITPELVQHAYNRKMKDVSVAAANHPMAPSELKIAKAAKDPEAAAQLARSSNDPEVLHSILKAHPDNVGVMKALSNNKALPPAAVNQIIKRQAKGDLKDPNSYHGRDSFDTGLHNHDNLDAEGRAHFLKSNPAAVASHPNLSTGEISGALKNWSEKSGDAAEEKRGQFVQRVMDHKNLSPSDAKDIVTGKYGSVEGNDFSYIHKNPETYTPEVIKAGLNVPHELSNKNLAEEMAESPQLGPKDVQDLYNKHNSLSDSNQHEGDKADHSASIIAGALRNPNAPESMRRDVLLGDHSSDQLHGHKIMAALNNPNITDDELKDFATKPHKAFESSVGRSNDSAVADEYRNVLAHKSKEDGKGAYEDALKNTIHPRLAESLIGDKYGSYGRGSVNSEHMKSALENKNRDVLKAVLAKYTNHMAPTQDRKGRTTKPDINPALIPAMDKLADHPDKDIATKAFQFMSPEKQQVVMERAGEDSANIIPHLSKQAVEHMAIKPDQDYESARAILAHPHATHDHLMQAAAHNDEDVARDAVKRIEADAESKSPKFTKEQTDQVLSTGLNKHPDDFRMAGAVARHTSDPSTVKKLLNDPERYSEQFGTLADNTSVKPSDLESLTKFHGPDNSKTFESLAGHKKTPVALLQHIVEHYPEHMAEVANSPKAANAKVLKKIVSSGDVDAKVNLVNNEKVPDGIKDELLKETPVLFKAKPENVSADQLKEYATDKDLKTVKAVVEHRAATKDVVDKAVKHALKQSKDDNSGATDVLKAAAKRDLSKDTAEKMLAHSPEIAKSVIQHQGQKLEENHVMDALSRYQGTKGYADVAQAAMARHAFHSPVIASQLINTADLNHVSKDGVAQSEALSNMFDNHKNLDGKHYEAAINKLAQARGTDFKYQSLGDKAASVKEGDVRLMNNLMSDAPDSVMTPHVDNPAFLPAIVKNDRLKEANLARVVDTALSQTPGDMMKGREYEDLVKQPNIKPEQLERIHSALDAAKNSKDEGAQNAANRGLKAIASSTAITPQFAKQLLQSNPDEVAHNPRLSSQDMESYIKEKTPSAEMTGRFATNPNFRLSMVQDHPQMKDPSFAKQIYHNLVSNMKADPKDLETVWDQGKGYMGRDQLNDLVRNPRTSDNLANSMLESNHVSKSDMEYNPSIGGKLWRDNKHEFPEGTGVEKGKEVPEAHFRPQEDKVRQVAAMVPPGGMIDWAEFKKEQPSLAGNPVIQKLFTSAPKQRVTKEHAEKYMSEMPGKKFLMSYSRWNGMQRHNSNNQTVFQINNSEQMDNNFKNNPDHGGLYRVIQNASQATGHPHGPQSIGWSRVDTAHPEHWFIDEVQSDFNSNISKELHAISETGQTKGLQDYGVDAKDAPKAVRAVQDGFMGWEKAILQNVIDTAKKHGVKKVSIHSGETKTMMNKGQEEGVTNKYDKIYNRLTQDMGFKAAKYDSIPTAGNDKLKGKDIWTLDLDQMEQAMKNPEKQPEQTEQEVGSAQKKVK
jgi:hypothetical protein